MYTITYLSAINQIRSNLESRAAGRLMLSEMLLLMLYRPYAGLAAARILVLWSQFIVEIYRKFQLVYKMKEESTRLKIIGLYFGTL